MAITVNPVVMTNIPVNGKVWARSLYSTDLTGGETLLAAVTGSCHYLTRLRIRCAGSTTISIGERVADTGALTTTLIGPEQYTLASTLESQFAIMTLTPPGFALKFQVGYGIGIIAGSAVAASIWIEGKTCKEGVL
jgi:hypothetical protein